MALIRPDDRLNLQQIVHLVSWCSWLSRQSNTLKVSSSSLDEIISFFIVLDSFFFLFSSRWYLYAFLAMEETMGCCSPHLFRIWRWYDSVLTRVFRGRLLFSARSRKQDLYYHADLASSIWKSYSYEFSLFASFAHAELTCQCPLWLQCLHLNSRYVCSHPPLSSPIPG